MINSDGSQNICDCAESKSPNQLLCYQPISSAKFRLVAYSSSLLNFSVIYITTESKLLFYTNAVSIAHPSYWHI